MSESSEILIKALRRSDPSLSFTSDEEIAAVLKGAVTVITTTIAPDLVAAKLYGGPAAILSETIADTLLRVAGHR
jgi:hypothetical protein